MSTPSLSWKKSACILCECNCGLEVQLDESDHFVRFRGDKAHPASRGYACEKPHRLEYYQHNRDRITAPMVRGDDGELREVSWDEAIAEAARRLTAVRDQHGGDSLFYYGGGGQGNHLPGAYATATRRVLGSRYRSSALAQEKTGEFWVSARMLGTYTRGDFEHCEVGMFLGKNPWHSHSIPRARVTLKALASDPARTLIVIDPRRSETAAMADIHLPVRPGTDAWLLAAMVAILLEDDLVDDEFIAEHTAGIDAVREAFTHVDVSSYCQRAGVHEALVRQATERIAGAASVASFEDLGVQMNRHSTLVSYLHRLVWLLTGNFGKRGTQYVPTPLVNLAGHGRAGNERLSPVAKAPIIAGMVPCNVIAGEILADEPGSYRAMIVEAANPAHSLADSKQLRAALEHLDTLVVIDVVMSETARLADIVLPATTQYEKAEATFFNFEFPENVFHLRPAIIEPPPGPLPEAEIHSRLVEAMGALDDADLLESLRAAAKQGLVAYAAAFLASVIPHPKRSAIAPILLYRTLGPILGDDKREAAVLLGAAFQAAMKSSPSLARAGFEGPPQAQALALFEAILSQPSGLVFAIDEWSECFARIANGTIALALPDMLEEVAVLETEEVADAEYPFVLSAGERRSFTANTIIRDPGWRKTDASGALRISTGDAANLGVSSGDSVRLTTRRDSVVVTVDVTEMMQQGHVSLPNGLGLDYPDDDGRQQTGVAPNELTAADDRDRFAGTPWHKHVPARIEPV